MAGTRWRRAADLAAGVDLVRSTGVRYAWQRRRERRLWAGVRADARQKAYEDIWRQAASEVGTSVRVLPDGYFGFHGEGALLRFRREHPPIDGDRALSEAGDKPRQYGRLADAGVPVPEHLEFSRDDPAPAAAFLEEASGPCVVKPALDTGAGSGVTSGIESSTDLSRALLRASRAGERLLIERLAEGPEYRALLLDGEVLDVVRRRPPTVVGDGEASVARLVAAENRRRLAGDEFERLRMLTLDLDAVLALRSDARTVRSSPPAGEKVRVKRAVNQNAARENETVRDGLGPDLEAMLARAADAAGLRLAGIDLVAKELAGPLAATDVILEVNPHPGLHHHYAVRDRRHATPVAVAILRTLLEARRERTRGGDDES